MTDEMCPAAGLVPLLVRLLYPKMRKRSGRLGGKGAPGSARAAILNCLAALDSIELAPLVQLFLQPISAAFKQQQLQGVEQSDDVSALRSVLRPPSAAPYIHLQALQSTWVFCTWIAVLLENLSASKTGGDVFLHTHLLLH